MRLAPSFPIGSPMAWCTVCGRTFLTGESFDLHRGIRVLPRREDAQDAGACMDFRRLFVAGLTYDEETERWGTAAEWAQVDRMARLRAARA